MIDIAAVRADLGEILAPADPAPGEAPAWNVYPSGLDDAAAFPAVIIGMPRWTPGPTGCIDLTVWPIAVVAEMPGGVSSFSAVIGDLDQLWPQVLATLTEAFKTDRRFGRAAHVERSEFSTYPVQGRSFPAQLIFVSIDG